MAAGLFGKLPSKRDFIAFRAPRPFLDLWEPWLQGSMAMSRHVLGADWTRDFNQAPIWRFWLGAELCGVNVLGAFMASVDGVGRAFPLALFCADVDGPVAPPELNPHDAWCDAAETILLRALDHEVSFDDVTRAAEALPSPTPAPADVVDAEQFPDGLVLTRPDPSGFAAAFEGARRLRENRERAMLSYWWTIGGENFPAFALTCRGMPAAQRFAEMLTGRFPSRSAARAEDSTGD